RSLRLRCLHSRCRARGSRRAWRRTPGSPRGPPRRSGVRASLPTLLPQASAPRSTGRRSVTDRFDIFAAARDAPERLALVQPGRAWSYADLAALCQRALGWLRAQGLEPGSAVTDV